jgi:hypothetical protein
MQDDGKRTVAITVRMTEAEAQRFEEAAKRLWTGALMTRSQVILSFAKLGLGDPIRRRL